MTEIKNNLKDGDKDLSKKEQDEIQEQKKKRMLQNKVLNQLIDDINNKGKDESTK